MGLTDDPAEMRATKRAFGLIACRYTPTNEGLLKLMADPEFKELFPNAVLAIDFGDGKAVHIVRPT